MAEDDDESLDAADVADALMSRKPSSEAIDKFNDYRGFTPSFFRWSAKSFLIM